MQFSVGDIIHNAITKEEGRIVRIAAIVMRSGYVVTTPITLSGKKIEAIWGLREVLEVRENVRLRIERAVEKTKCQNRPKSPLRLIQGAGAGGRRPAVNPLEFHAGTDTVKAEVCLVVTNMATLREIPP